MRYALKTVNIIPSVITYPKLSASLCWLYFPRHPENKSCSSVECILEGLRIPATLLFYSHFPVDPQIPGIKHQTTPLTTKNLCSIFQTFWVFFQRLHYMKHQEKENQAVLDTIQRAEHTHSFRSCSHLELQLLSEGRLSQETFIREIVWYC